LGTLSQLESSPAKSPAHRGLHVLTLTPFYPSAGDDVSGCFVAESNKELELQGIHSQVIAVGPLHYQTRKSNSSSPAEWIRYPQFPGSLGLPNAGRWLYLRLLNKIARVHRQKRIDLIHAHAALPCGHAAALLSQRLNVPFVVTVHGLDVFNTCFLDDVSMRRRHQASVSVYRAARQVICISKKVQGILQSGAFDSRSVVVYNGTDTALFSPAESVVPQAQAEI
jgi:teichuronic acid biosynthesis glycosyltransferase TuaC